MSRSIFSAPIIGLLFAVGLFFAACDNTTTDPAGSESRQVRLSVFNGVYAEKVNFYLEYEGQTTVLATGVELGQSWPQNGYSSVVVRIPAELDTAGRPTQLVVRGYSSDTVLYSSYLDVLEEGSRYTFYVVQENDSTYMDGYVADVFTTPGIGRFNFQFANLSATDTVRVRGDSTIKLDAAMYNTFSMFKDYPVKEYSLTVMENKLPHDTLVQPLTFVPQARRSYSFFLVRNGATAAYKLVPITRE